jgi:CRP-like cAMP-binding protein
MPLSNLNQAIRTNKILASLPVADNAFLSAAIRIERPPSGFVLSTRAEPSTEVWFPMAGVVALSFTDTEGRTAQTGIIGPEGCIGCETLLHRASAMADAAVQVAGEMSVIPAAILRTAFESRPAVRAAFTHFFCLLATQSLQTVACNRLHSLEARCCRWLLMIQDRTGDDELQLTQESLATMLGGGRPRINGLLAALEQDGLLRRYRGRIRLLSRRGLKARACECYRLTR